MTRRRQDLNPQEGQPWGQRQGNPLLTRDCRGSQQDGLHVIVPVGRAAGGPSVGDVCCGCSDRQRNIQTEAPEAGEGRENGNPKRRRIILRPMPPPPEQQQLETVRQQRRR